MRRRKSFGNKRKFQPGPGTVKDLFALDVKWTPLSSYTWQLVTHKIVRKNSRELVVQPSFSLLIRVFFLVSLFIYYIWYFDFELFREGVMAVLVALIICGLIFYLIKLSLKSCKKTTFNLDKNVIFHGRDCYTFDQIYALQIIEKLDRFWVLRHFGISGDDFLTEDEKVKQNHYELNCVLKSKNRFHLCSNEKLEKTRDLASEIAKELECPIWDEIES